MNTQLSPYFVLGSDRELDDKSWYPPPPMLLIPSTDGLIEAVGLVDSDEASEVRLCSPPISLPNERKFVDVAVVEAPKVTAPSSNVEKSVAPEPLKTANVVFSSVPGMHLNLDLPAAVPAFFTPLPKPKDAVPLVTTATPAALFPISFSKPEDPVVVEPVLSSTTAATPVNKDLATMQARLFFAPFLLFVSIG